MKSIIIVAALVLAVAAFASANPQYTGCGPNGCISTDQYGRTVQCNGRGCQIIQPYSQRNRRSPQYGTPRPGAGCDHYGCRPIPNNGYGIGCGPNGCGPLPPPTY